MNRQDPHPKVPVETEAASEEEVVVLPIEDSLDLHSFPPREIKDLLHDYLEEACRKQFAEVRIIHGKGTGTLRATVHAILQKHPLVVSFRQADGERGGWGATCVTLRSRPEPDRD